MSVMDETPAPETPAPRDAAPPAPLHQRLFGAWQPPEWPRRVLAWLRARPGPRLGLPLAGLLFLAVGLWWGLREVPPPPDAIGSRLEPPAATDYTATPPRVSPLRLRFDAAVAPLEAVGEAGSTGRPVEGLQLRPAIAGRWEYEDDRTLRFSPAEDWPVGQTVTVELDPGRALAPGRVLAQQRWRFETPGFTVGLLGAEFHQDPEDPRLKRAVWELGFSHPVDGAGLRSALQVEMTDGAGRRLAAPALDLRLDEAGLRAWVQTAPLSVPENGGQVRLQVASGLKSRLPGPGRSLAVQGRVVLPDLYSVAVSELEALVVDDERGEPRQVLHLAFNERLLDREVAGRLKAWLLPEGFVPGPNRPARADDAGQRRVPYPWQPGEVDAAVLAAATPLALEALPGEREWNETHSFRFQAPPGRRLWVELPRGLKSFGGFVLGEPQRRLLVVPEYPKLLRFVGEGSLLSLRGERRVSLVARNHAWARLEIGRVLPEQLALLVAGNFGSFQQPSLWRVGEDALVERFEEVLALPVGDPARPQYRGVDLGEYFAQRRGVFLLSLRSLGEDEAGLTPRERLDRNAGQVQDSRLVVLSDLGVLSKQELDGSRKVFVQRFSDGRPVPGARVAVVARNGQVVVAASTDAEGVATLPSLAPFVRERAPVLLQVTSGEDLSFLPLDDWARRLDTSRFDVGGEVNQADPGALRAVLFSDRGLYRPGETVHLGLLLRAQEWSRTPVGVPLELDITDPAGALVRRETVRFGEAGFEGVDFTPPESGPSGTWTAQLYLKGSDARERRLVGGTTVQVREFQPDTLRVKLALSAPAAGGWARPEGLKAEVAVENLFGTPAQDRRVSARLRLTPTVPAFPGWPGFRFHALHQGAEGLEVDLEELRTDAGGRAVFPLGLEQYERTSYRMDLLVRAFEPGSGRGVAATLRSLVSDQPFLVGLKPDEGLHHVKRGARAQVAVLALGPDGRPRAVDGLQAVRIEKRMVSVLTQGEDGLRRFVSRERREERGRQPLSLGAAPVALGLATDTPGDFELEIQDADGRVLNRQAWTVVGEANLSRSLERDAELQLSLDRPAYAPGEEIEVAIRAPYAGAGLITIERDRVYAHRWFKVDTTSTVQRIRVPEGLEGNAYVGVSFLRDPESEAIHLSPLSWGLAPFAIDRGARQLALGLEAPARARPGQPLALRVTSPGKARVAVFAVDEGILQVAGYRVGDPLDQFLAKRMHQVESQQILDLLLPEFSRILAAAAPGGDGEAAGARHLNPFKRRGEAPAVWWSGVVDFEGERRFEFTPPDHFNGELRLVAVAATPERMALREARTTVRGDFVLTPSLPTHVAPGDVFELPVGLANTVEGAQGPLEVALQLALPEGLALEGAAPAPVRLAPGEETVLRLRLRAGDTPGARTIGLSARSGRFSAQRRLSLSVRPAQPSLATLRVQAVAKETPLAGLRAMHEAESERRFAASTSPLVAIDGLSAWLGGYRYTCTEQLASKALPALVLHSRPGLGRLSGDTAFLGLLDALRARQNGEGGFGTWTSSPEVDPFVSAYATLVLVEARERGVAVPGDLLERAGQWLRQAAQDPQRTDLPGLRARALAVYLQVRQGEAAGNALASLVEQLERDQPKAWREDLAGLLVAASYQGLQQAAAAEPLARRARELANAAAAPAAAAQPGDDYHNPLSAQAWRLYLLGRHFPAQARQLAPAAVERLLDGIGRGMPSSLGAALAVLALDALGGEPTAPVSVEQVWPGGRAPFGEVRDGVLAGQFRADAQQLRVRPQDGTRVWVALSERGFDRQPPPAVQDRGLEVQRDFLDAEGRPTTSVVQGGELVVRLRLRGRGWNQVALLDLLPGGFEPVLAPPPEATMPLEADGEGDAGGEDTDGGMPGAPPAPVLALPGSSWQPDHEEIREDRVVLYGAARPELAEYRYRIRATAVGRFQVPPVFAEHLYQPEVIARGGPAGTLTVTEPER